MNLIRSLEERQMTLNAKRAWALRVGGVLAVVSLGMPVVAEACECKGMTWTWRSRTVDVDLVGNDGTTNAYQGDTSCWASLPVLCLYKAGLAKPSYITAVDYYRGWSGGYLALTRSYPGTSLTSRAAADNLCAATFGSGWVMGEHHDGGGGWGWYAYGAVSTSSRFWVAINDQPANPWNSCVTPAPYCGDGVCNGSESSYNCVSDCGYPPNPSTCGDGLCSVEEQYCCPQDCGVVSLPVSGLRPICPNDPGPNPYCGDGVCSGGENSYSCPSDCGYPSAYCGDGVCNGGENSYSCPLDCGSTTPVCGDGLCSANEQFCCPQDCGVSVAPVSGLRPICPIDQPSPALH